MDGCQRQICGKASMKVTVLSSVKFTFYPPITTPIIVMAQFDFLTNISYIMYT